MDSIDEQNVARGAALLDEECLNWHEHIDQPQLRMSSVYDCILGQLYGGYEEGLHQLFPDADGPSARHERGIEHGFDTVGSYSEVHDLWHEQIEQRQS